MSDDITYYICEDTSVKFLASNGVRYYIRAGYPHKFLTDNHPKREINRIAKAMRQLGFTVIDRTK